MIYWNELKKILKLIWIKNTKTRILMIISLLIVYLAAIGQIFIPVILKHIIDTISVQSHIEKAHLSLLIWLLFSYGVTWSICQLLPALRVRLTFSVIEKILIHILSNAINNLIDMEFMTNAKKKTGELIVIIGRVQTAVAQFLDGVFIQLIPVIIQIIFVLIIIYKNFGLSYSLLLLLIIITYSVLAKFSLDDSVQLRIENNKDNNNFINYLMDTLQHYDVVKYFNNENYEKQKIYELLNIKKASSLRMFKRESIFFALQVIIVGLGLTIVTILSGKAVLNHKISIGGFVLLNSYILQFSLPLSYLGYVVQAVKRNFADLKEFSNHVQFKNITCINLPTVEINNFDIEFKNVTYTYDCQKIILNDISFTLKYGEKLVILGKTGSGKSTLIKLLLGLIKPTTGTILLGGVDITKIPISQLMHFYGVIPQDCALFNRTVLENIQYGNLDVSEEKIYEVMMQLQLDHINSRDTIGERSIRVSGGEKQRIALARLLLRKCHVCIFDEFTSSLDSVTEHKVLQLVNNLFKSKTRIIISHKLSVIEPSDKILVLDNAKIVAFDTHINLLKINHGYQKKWHSYNTL